VIPSERSNAVVLSGSGRGGLRGQQPAVGSVHDTAIAQGNGFQAGMGELYAFNAVITGTFVVKTAGNVTLDVFTDDGFFMGVGNGATRVSGDQMVGGPVTTPFFGYPVLASYNQGTAPIGRLVTVNFPAPGLYPFELDYSECCGQGLSLTLTASAGSGYNGPAPAGSLELTPA